MGSRLGGCIGDSMHFVHLAEYKGMWLHQPLMRAAEKRALIP